MGDLAIRVCMGDYVVEDRLLRVRGVTQIGDCSDAKVAFPGATLGVIRSGRNYHLRGQTLREGDRWQMSLGTVDVLLENVARTRSRSTIQSVVDVRFLATALVVVAVGSWVDSVETWVDRQPLAYTVHGGDGLKRLMLRIHGGEVERRTAGVSPSGQGNSDGTSRSQTIADGPRHAPDDQVSRTAYHRWYRKVVPRDPLAADANDRLLMDSDDVYARRIVARAAYNADRFDTAAWHYRILLDSDPMDRGLLIRMAKAERRRGYHRNEISMYRRILERNGSDPLALHGLSTGLARMGRIDEAVMVLDHLEMVSPTDPFTELTTATVSALAGETREALQALERAISARAQLGPEQQIELRRDIAIDPAFASLRKDKRLRGVLRRHLTAAAPRPIR